MTTTENLGRPARGDETQQVVRAWERAQQKCNRKILIADDDQIQRRLLEKALVEWSYEVVVTQNGQEAWQKLQRDTALSLAILDWNMPGLEGPDVCRNVRTLPRPVYVILLTSNSGKEEVYQGLRAGADDYLTKPFHRQELFARLQVGVRIVELQKSFAGQTRELDDLRGQVQVLQDLLPVCPRCKNVREDDAYWRRVEQYQGNCLDSQSSQGLCKPCSDKEPIVFPSGMVQQAMGKVAHS